MKRLLETMAFHGDSRSNVIFLKVIVEPQIDDAQLQAYLDLFEALEKPAASELIATLKQTIFRKYPLLGTVVI